MSYENMKKCCVKHIKILFTKQFVTGKVGIYRKERWLVRVKSVVNVFSVKDKLLVFTFEVKHALIFFNRSGHLANSVTLEQLQVFCVENTVL